MAKLGFVAAVFAGIITWGALRDLNKVLFVSGATFIIVAFGFLAMNWLTKDEDVKPGEPRLK